MEILYKTTLAVTIIGALNWGFIGLFNLDLVALVFGDMTMLTRLVYDLVGISGIISVGIFFYHFDMKRDLRK